MEECAERAIRQKQATCWLTSVMNVLFLSSNIYGDLLEMYDSRRFSTDMLRYFEHLIHAKTCIPPRSEEHTKEQIKYFIFAFIYYFQNKKYKTKSPFTLTAKKATLVKRFYGEDASLAEPYYAASAIELIFDILFTSIDPRTFKHENKKVGYILSRSSLRDIEPRSQDLLEAVIIFVTLNSNDHFITGFKCHNKYFIYDSNTEEIFGFNFTADNWQTELAKLYQEEYGMMAKNMYIHFYIYRFLFES